MTIAELNKTFERCKSAGKAAFIPYITAGFPTKDCTVLQLLSLQKAGADIIELGMPFSDPLADGPTIQRSSFIALAGGVKMVDCLRYF